MVNFKEEIKRVERLLEERDTKGLVDAFIQFEKNCSTCPGKDKWASSKEFSDERRRLFIEASDTYSAYKDALARLLGDEFGLSTEESEIVFEKAWESGCEDSVDAVVYEFERLAFMVSEVREVWDREKRKLRKWSLDTTLDDVLCSKMSLIDKVKIMVEMSETQSDEGNKCLKYIEEHFTNLSSFQKHELMYESEMESR